ncbi:hypothetical protein T03_6447 [Trichinella britovi]|uniref:Uncharacterized protein n=1 Tax=Trichinella britovi TaxID=45882 RepID=A0A0V1AKI7_TRIBR|nr:hypothetical protein T03_6447 [Trichinella britovi]
MGSILLLCTQLLVWEVCTCMGRALFGDWVMTSAISLANYCDK